MDPGGNLTPDGLANIVYALVFEKMKAERAWSRNESGAKRPARKTAAPRASIPTGTGMAIA